MSTTDLKTLDLETQDVTARSWEQLVEDLVGTDPVIDIPVGSDPGTGATSCYCYTSSTCH